MKILGWISFYLGIMILGISAYFKGAGAEAGIIIMALSIKELIIYSKLVEP